MHAVPRSSRVEYAHFTDKPEKMMGKGDKRTRKGKIYRGSYGKTRPGRPKKKAKRGKQ